MKVLITIDVECDHSHGYDEMVVARCGDGQQWGITYIAKTLFDHDLKGVFFMEPMGSKRYGRQGLREAVDLVFSYGHEIQLHLHPSFKGGSDALHHYGLKEQLSLIQEGKHILKQCGASHISAFRAGSFSANLDTLKAAELSKIPFDSSYNLNYIYGNCRIDTGYFLNHPTWMGSIWEFPVTCFNWPFHRLRDSFRHLQITAAGIGETLDALTHAQKLNYGFATILLHSFEFITRRQRIFPDMKNIHRFESLCKNLQRQSDIIQTTGFSSLQMNDLENWAIDGPMPIPTVRLSSWFSRNLEQLTKRIRGSITQR